MEIGATVSKKLERGRSRFSKALPVPPQTSQFTMEEGKLPSTSPLPPIPKDKMSALSIPRRPVGCPRSYTLSVDTVSSVYSDSPGFLSRSFSNSSRETKHSLSGADSGIEVTPPIPPKRQLPQTPKNVLGSPNDGFQSSPPRPELWRRRSVKSDRSLSISELKLLKSNGSTTSPPQKPPPERSLPAIPSQLPRSITGRKPVPARPAPRQPSLMGNKLSKSKGKRALDGARKDDAAIQQFPSFNQLPTPDYLKADRQQPFTPRLISPVSPETPPDDELPPVPPKSESRNATTKPLATTTNTPNFLVIHSREPSEALTVNSEPAMRSPQPKKVITARILTPQPSPSPKPDTTSPLALPSASFGISFPHVLSPSTIIPGLPLDIVHLVSHSRCGVTYCRFRDEKCPYSMLLRHPFSLRLLCFFGK
jgi:hypothetical protein